MLHLDSGANISGESVSRQLTALFANRWRAEADYRYRDLAADPVPPLRAAYCRLGRRAERTGLVPAAEVAALIETPAEQQEWELTLPLIEELLAADIVLIGAPMYNYSIPAALKAWIDRVSFPGAFIEPATRQKLLRDTTIVIVSPRGGAYRETPRADWDFLTPYLRAYFGKLGVAEPNLHFVHAEMTLAGLVPRLAGQRPQAANSLAAARSDIIALAISVTDRNVTADWQCPDEAARVVR